MSDFPPDSVAFVTGAASGIGFATAKVLLQSGITKISILDLTTELLAPASDSLSQAFPNAQILAVPCNCASESDIDAAVAKTVERFGRIDFCLNAAGVSGTSSRIDEMQLANWEKVMGVNAKGVWMSEKAQIKQMLKQETRDVSGLPVKTRGAIVNIGSLASNIAIAELTPYVMSKHAVLGLTKADAIDYAKDGIRINCIAPGCIMTSMTTALWTEGPSKSTGDGWVTRAPMSRWGAPEEVANAAVFLLSDKASFITGTCLNVDGGYCAQ